MLTVFCNLAAVFTVPPLVAWIIAFEDVKLDAIALLVKLVLTVLLPLLVCRCIKPGIIPAKQTFFVEFLTIGHFTVMDGGEAEGDLVLIQTFLLYYVNQVILMLTSIFQEQFP